MPRVLLVARRDWRPDLERTVVWREDVQRACAVAGASGLHIAESFKPQLIVLDAVGEPGRVEYDQLRLEALGDVQSARPGDRARPLDVLAPHDGALEVGPPIASRDQKDSGHPGRFKGRL